MPRSLLWLSIREAGCGHFSACGASGHRLDPGGETATHGELDFHDIFSDGCVEPGIISRVGGESFPMVHRGVFSSVKERGFLGRGGVSSSRQVATFFFFFFFFFLFPFGTSQANKDLSPCLASFWRGDRTSGRLGGCQ